MNMGSSVLRFGIFLFNLIDLHICPGCYYPTVLVFDLIDTMVDFLLSGIFSSCCRVVVELFII